MPKIWGLIRSCRSADLSRTVRQTRRAGLIALPLVIAAAALLCLAGGAYARANADQALAIAVDGPGQVNGNGIACRDGSGDCVELYADGTSVTLTAVPDSGATFTGWGGDCTAAGTNAACTMTMGSARAVTATFTLRRRRRRRRREADPDGQPGRQRQGDRQRDQLRRRQHRLLRVVQPRHRGHAHRDAQHGRDVLRLGRRVQRHLDHLHRDDERVAERRPRPSAEPWARSRCASASPAAGASPARESTAATATSIAMSCTPRIRRSR